MAQQPAADAPLGHATTLLGLVGRLTLVLAVVLAIFLGASALSGNLTPRGAAPGAAVGGSARATPSAPVDIASYLDRQPRPAAAIELIGANDAPFSLASLRGAPALVFFGYTHCPDVCPATIGTVGLAIDAFGPGPRAVFVSVDPERDTTAWLREYVRFMPASFIALTGTSTQIRATADAWGVRYARVETGEAGAYSMSHTADVLLVDAAGMVRARFPFGTSSEAMTAVLRYVAVTPVARAPVGTPAVPLTPSVRPTPSSVAEGAAPSPTLPSIALAVDVVSSSVWAGPAGPVILRLSVAGARIDDTTIKPSVQLVAITGDRIGGPVAAVAVRPPGEADVSYVADLAAPAPGAWRIEVSAAVAGRRAVGSAPLDVLDPGATAAIGAAAPSARTPTLTDVGGVVRALTTDPAPDLRLSQTSTVDALAAGRPFVLVADSTRFRVSPACGRAIVMARYLLDRWRDVAFIHLEPYRYTVVADTAVLDGTLAAPTLTDPAAAWGIGGDPWGPRSMPWIFVVDGHGIVRAKYHGVSGSDDVDVIVSLIAQGG